MGYDASCTITIDGKSAEGTAWLEHKALVFRGPYRLSIPLTAISEATAQNGILRVQFGSRRAEFAIGSMAAKWADRIVNPPSRLAKLGLKPGMTVALVNVEDPDFEAELTAHGVTWSERAPRRAAADAVFYGVERVSDLDRLSALSKAIIPAGAVWVIRRKGRDTPVSEGESMAAGKRAGLVDVKVVSFSETHSAEKYVIPVARRAAPVRSTPSPRRRGSAPSRARS
jgi:hypothetical protein